MKKIPKINLKVTASKVEPENLYKISSSKDAFDCFNEVFNLNTMLFFEEMHVLCLSQANEVIGNYQISKGGRSGTLCDLKILFAIALKMCAVSIVLAHNHPSGQLRASEADNKLTEQIKQAGKILTINLVDHLIIHQGKYYSYADNGNII